MFKEEATRVVVMGTSGMAWLRNEVVGPQAAAGTIFSFENLVLDAEGVQDKARIHAGRS
jgi:hypothetical protein